MSESNNSNDFTNNELNNIEGITRLEDITRLENMTHLEDMTHLENMTQLEDITHLEDNSLSSGDSYTPKRKKVKEHESLEQWTTVTRRGKKIRGKDEAIQYNLEEEIKISVTASKDRLPKQFTLARLLDANSICGVKRIKYIGPFKMHIIFDDRNQADTFMKHKILTDMDWRCQDTSEVNISYGIIKDIETDQSLEQILNNIYSDYEIVSAKRLNRRQQEGEISTDDSNGWIPSETIRLGFKSSSLPRYIKLFNTNISVDKYIFPVTQCSKCWKFGHTSLKCGAHKITCSKCAQNHPDCETNSYVCVNCCQNHRAVDKNCPVYKKEKTIRELMSEFNCTYQKALLLFVPVSPAPLRPINKNNYADFPTINNVTTTSIDTNYHEKGPTYAEKVKLPVSDLNNMPSTSTNSKSPKTTKRKHTNTNKHQEHEEEIMEFESFDTSTSTPLDLKQPTACDDKSKEEHKKRKGYLSFLSVMRRISEIIIRDKCSLANKIESVIKIIWEWLMSVAMQYLADGSLIMNFFNGLQS
ncbi:hypothetical protein K1T71_001631 [Dendrolimus kikuchii]|uniref:Uncharacterized protein n=2 Tax=Dendrolimus kikuchii TaxID=765133 RepID=A0ACC1D3T7_9NEOP|nr:hypothetical protein K1T71_005358 [Dendrolimus kikuchii]KAJ0182262.1 hypothetical protein K1T71_001631 [Dendrolimus kikuchii]